MLFNSYEFILLFLPLTLIGFFLIGARAHHRIATAWLVAASLLFYGWWNPAYLGLILASMLGNYAFGLLLAESGGRGGGRGLLALGIGLNLALLGYYKYANFFVDNLNDLLGTGLVLETIILPLAISFFTFQQIAYLVDAWKGETREYNFLHYALFVTFFPQLIAGPIVHHREMLPQFARESTYRFNADKVAVGLSLFILGLFKKVVLADTLARYASTGFNTAAAGDLLSFFEAWRTTLAYTFQLYFDFSGYSDMAMGIAFMFGIMLPLNFNSPYQAVNIIDFWRRWHITLSRFLRDYLYIPLGGNRKGATRRYINLFLTMLLGGLWHGAAWTFVLWGALHGLYLGINHAWHALRRRLGWIGEPGRAGLWLGRFITLLAVAFAWVLFRADSLDTAGGLMASMLGLNGIAWPSGTLSVGSEALLTGLGVEFRPLELFKGGGDLLIIALVLGLVWGLPNNVQILGPHLPTLEPLQPARRLRWRPSTGWAVLLALAALTCILKLAEVSEFLYFQF